MVLEIINKMPKNQKSSLIVWNTVLPSVFQGLQGFKEPSILGYQCLKISNTPCQRIFCTLSTRSQSLGVPNSISILYRCGRTGDTSVFFRAFRVRNSPPPPPNNNKVCFLDVFHIFSPHKSNFPPINYISRKEKNPE